MFLIANVAYDTLFKDGFLYTHTWIPTQQTGSQLLIAKSRSMTFKQDLKRVLDDDATDNKAKRAKEDSEVVTDDTNTCYSFRRILRTYGVVAQLFNQMVTTSRKQV